MSQPEKKISGLSSKHESAGRRSQAVVVGASAGALEALAKVFGNLPKSYPLPIFLVVHVPPDKKSVMVEVLARVCAMRVIETEDKEPIEGGVIYLAPPDYHLLVEVNRQLSLSSEEPVQFSRPSIDVLFESAADAYGKGLIGVILTGANSDGARGLKAVIDAGGQGLVQRPESAHASQMPQAAIDLSSSARALSLEEIAAFLREAALV